MGASGCFPQRGQPVFKGVEGNRKLASKVRLSLLRLFVLDILEVTLQDEIIILF
jgi:hypothetical protein